MRKDRIAKAFALFMTLVIAGTTGCGGRKTGLNETGNKNVSTQKTSDIQKKDGESSSSEVQDKKKELVGKKKKSSVNLSNEEVKKCKQIYKDYNSSLLYHFLKQSWGDNPQKGLVACSNINMYLANGMLSEMTAGQSREQILNSFGKNMFRAAVSDCINVNDREEKEWEEEQKIIRKMMGYISGKIKSENCSLGNSAWLSDKYDYSGEAGTILKNDYNAYSLTGEMGSKSFNDKINKWIDEQTGGKIKGNLKTNKDMAMLLLSAVNFKEQWKVRFDKNNTKTGIFYGQSAYTCGNTTEEEKIDKEKCSFLNSEYAYAYTENGRYQAVSIPMTNANMNIILPKENVAADKLINNKDAKQIISLCNTFNKKWDYSKIVKFSMPKLDFKSELELNPLMQDMGIKNIFNGKKADFSKMFVSDGENKSEGGIYVSKAKQNSRMTIDENGCSMASYTEIALEALADEKKDTVTMNCNRPFIIIVSTSDGLPIFMGAVNRVA